MAEANTLNLASLKIETAELPERAGGRQAKVQIADNPFVGPIGDSYAQTTGRQVKVAKADLKDVERLLRSAAKHLGLGVRIVTDPKGEALEKAGNAKQVTVKFQGQKAKVYKKRAEKASQEVTEQSPQH